ncbi:mediator complex, subunit Med1 [Purpureocillium lavendulum]|uniref:Mediator complex, subunit Med1 n=1 Tax=Purpureocillium lavendulum TaxID=1247861 RepID=A0AB34FVT7_9HYPO|nr:mediator complex, subunit Med1 [Purpureocillium lavendulum]
MERISLLTVSKVEPAVSIGPHSTVVRRLSPSLILATRWQRFVATTSCSVLLHAYLTASATLAHVLHAGRFLAVWALGAAKVGALHGLLMSGKAVADAWDSQPVRSVRQKFFYEFAVFILGGGNAIILLLFWPGWLILAGAIWTLYRLWG